MAIGVLSSSKSYSSLKFGTEAISNRFSTTTEDQEMVKFLGEDGTLVRCNAISITAGAGDLYFAVCKEFQLVDGANYDFSNAPVYYVPAGGTLEIKGLEISGLKFNNASGASYFIQGMAY